MSARRLIAYVERAGKDWRYRVEVADEGEDAVVLDGLCTYLSVLDAQRGAEGHADRYGFSLDWRGGFVAHGVPVEREGSVEA